MFFVIEFSLTITSCQFFENDWIFINHSLFVGEKTIVILEKKYFFLKKLFKNFSL